MARSSRSASSSASAETAAAAAPSAAPSAASGARSASSGGAFPKEKPAFPLTPLAPRYLAYAGSFPRGLTREKEKSPRPFASAFAFAFSSAAFALFCSAASSDRGSSTGLFPFPARARSAASAHAGVPSSARPSAPPAPSADAAASFSTTVWRNFASRGAPPIARNHPPTLESCGSRATIFSTIAFRVDGAASAASAAGAEGPLSERGGAPPNAPKRPRFHFLGFGKERGPLRLRLPSGGDGGGAAASPLVSSTPPASGEAEASEGAAAASALGRCARRRKPPPTRCSGLRPPDSLFAARGACASAAFASEEGLHKTLAAGARTSSAPSPAPAPASASASSSAASLPEAGGGLQRTFCLPSCDSIAREAAPRSCGPRAAAAARVGREGKGLLSPSCFRPPLFGACWGAKVPRFSCAAAAAPLSLLPSDWSRDDILKLQIYSSFDGPHQWA